MKHSADPKSPPMGGDTSENLTINASAAKPIKAKITPAAELKPRAAKVVNTNEAPDAHGGFASQFSQPEPGSKRSLGFRGIAVGAIVLLLVGALVLSFVGGDTADIVAEAPVVPAPVAPIVETPVVATVVEAPIVPEPVVEVVAPVVAPVAAEPIAEPIVVPAPEFDAASVLNPNDLVAQMTAGVMSALAQPSRADIEAAEATGVGAGLKHSDLYNLVTTALVQGQSDAYIDLLINDAANTGRIDVPDALRTADGKVNTAAILAVVGIQQ